MGRSSAAPVHCPGWAEGGRGLFIGSWVLGAGFGGFQKGVESRAVVEMAVGDDGGDFAGVVDVGERIGVEEDEVGEFAFGDRALGGLGTEESGGIARGGLQRF